MQVDMKITNVYTDGDEIENRLCVDVPELDYGQDRDEWAEMHLWPFTGADQSGNAGYFVEILDCPEMPSLVGAEFEYGV